MNFRKSLPDGAIRACTISEHISKFDLLIEDMENIMGEAWGDLGISAAKTFMNQSDGLYLEFVAITVDENIANKSEQLIDLVQTAKARDIKSIIVAKNVNPVLLHRLLKAGADGFVPYPLPQNELSEAVEQALAEPTVQSAAASPMLLRNGMV